MPSLLPLFFLALFSLDTLSVPTSPSQPGCADGNGVRDLLKRLEILEKLVRDIKGQCSQPCCASGQTGADDPSSHRPLPCPQSSDACPEGCGGDARGICVDGQCQCKDGYMGDKCELETCPDDCNDQGRCVKGRCICFKGYFGPNCGSRTCPNDCQNNGRCEDGICICDSGYVGLDCSTRICPKDCLNRGKCVNGICVCASGFTGVDCSSRTCPKKCLNRGKCENGVCVCASGFTGPDCSSRTCPNNCQNHGRCERGVCVCDPGFTGFDCSSRTCPNDCHNHGRCEDGVCVCNPGFSGSDCSLETCPEDCNEQGQCVSGVCICEPGFVGIDCGTRICSPECERRGRCEDGECVCNPGYTGTDCETKTCPNDCNKRGRCDDGECLCDSGYTGIDCGSRTCPNKCHNHGKCEDGVCVCNPGYTGLDCGSRTCPKNCSGNGQCVNGKCVCDSGFSGPVCGIRTCPVGCTKHGRCVKGSCICAPGFTGPDCGTKLCPKNCHNQGRCKDGVCICDSGFDGLDCGSRTCPNDCKDQGQCNNGVCICNSGFSGLDCGSKTCPNNCQNRGQCNDGECFCDSGFTGPDCGTRTCPNDCYYRGQCEDGICICDSGYTDIDCGSKTCPNNCHNHGQCDDGECICDSGYTGMDCGSRTCLNDCKNRGVCDDGTCICDSGYTGPDCGSRTCPNNCNNRGKCNDGECVCDSGYTDLDCGSRTCPENCNSRGQCEDGVCICDYGYTGVDCSSTACLENCHNHGSCDDGKCVCDIGYTGPACELRTCPDNCLNRGRCEDGICVCQAGYTGPDCGSRACPKDCSGNGQCVNGKCVCNLGFSGPVCGARSCPGNCAGRGKCVNGLCICKKGFTGVDCKEVITEVTAVTGLRVTSQEETTVTLEWDPPQTTPDSYDISFKSKKENGLINGTLEGSVTLYRQTGLAPGEEYTVTIHPCKGQTVGPDTSVTAITKVEAPRGLRVTELTISSFLLRWERPQSLPERYIVTLTMPNGKERKLRVPGKGDKARITGLEEGTTYKVTLRAEKGQEQSDELETTAITAVGGGRKNLDDDPRTVVTSQSQGRPEKKLSSVDVDHTDPASTVGTSSNVGVGEDGLQTREVLTDEQYKKGSRVTHTTKKNTITTIITTYHTHHREHEGEDDVNVEEQGLVPGQDKMAVTTLVEEGDLGERFQGEPNVRTTHFTEKVPGHIVERWVVRRNITHFGTSGEETPTYLQEADEKTKKIYTHLKLPPSEWEDVRETSDGLKKGAQVIHFGSSREMTTTHSEDEELATQVQKESGTKNPYIQSKFTLHSGSTEHTETLARELEPSVLHESNSEKDHMDSSGENDSTDVTADGKKLKKTSTKVTVHRIVTTSKIKHVGKESRDHNETNSERDVEENLKLGNKNQTRIGKTPVLRGSVIKDVIENLPEKLSMYNGTFIQRLESYLRATNYPLKGNQTIQSVARSIFLYLVKWKPHSFTGLVYDRLPQKTPGAIGNEEPTGSSRIRGNSGRLEDAVEETQEKISLNSKGRKPESKKIPPLHSELNTLGRVEAAGEVEIPVSLTVQNYGSISDHTDASNSVVNLIPNLEKRQVDKEGTSKNTTTKATLEKISGRGSHRRITPTKKPPISETKKEFSVDERVVSKTEIKEKDRMDIEDREGQTSKDYEKPTNRTKPDRSTVRPVEQGIPSTHPKKTTQTSKPSSEITEESNVERSSPISENLKIKPESEKEEDVSEGSLIYDIKKKEDLIKGDTKTQKYPQILAPTHPRVRQGQKERDRELVNEGLGSSESTGKERESSLLIKQEINKETRIKEERKTVVNQIVGSVDEQDQTDSLRDTFSVKVPGQGSHGLQRILQKTSTSLVLSLEGLGVLWDRVLVLYRPWPPSTRVSPQQLEVEKGAKELEIGGLKPGTSYRIELHGFVRGRSSKSYSLVAVTAQEPTPTPIQSEIKATIAPTTPQAEVIPTKAPTVTRRPTGSMAQMGALQVRDVTSDSVTLVWKARNGTYDSFLVRYEDVTDNLRPPQETSVPGDLRIVTLNGLIQNTRYAVSVYGVNGGKLSRPLKEEVTTESDADRGTAPRLSPLSVSDVRPDSFILTWEPLDGDFDAYLLQYGPPGGPSQELTLRGDETYFRLTGLVTGVNYTVELHGIWGEKYSEPENIYVLTVKPQPPQLESLSVSDVRSDSIVLSWLVQGEDFDSFLLSYRDAEGKQQEKSLEGDLRTVKIKDLRPGKKYKFALYGISGNKRSKSVIAETVTAKPVPPHLESISVSEVHSDSIGLSWEVKDAEFDTFLLYYRDAEGKPQEISLEGNLRTFTVSDLRPGKKYKFVLYGISGGKRGKAVIAETSTARREKPVAPSPSTPAVARLVDLEASEVGRDSVKLSWRVEGEPPFEWIVVQYRDPEGGVRELQIPGGDTSTYVPGLLPSRKYKFNVYGVIGETRSKSISTEVMTDFPEAVGQPSSLLDDLFLAPQGPHAMLLSWEAPEGSFDSFRVQYTPQGHQGSTKEAWAEGSARTLLLSDLQADTLYTVTVYGVREEKEHDSLEATGRTGPLELEPPLNIRFNDIGETSVIVNWDPPSPETTTFKVSYQLADGGEPESISVVGSSTPLQGLIPGTRYEVTVVSVRGFEESQPLTGYTTTVGGGPRSLRALDVTEESALLRWDPPLGPVDNYLVTYTAENIHTVTQNTDGDRTEYRLTGLQPHSEYTASVQSIHGSKISPPATTSFTTSDNSPRDLSASQIMAHSALLTWTAPQALPDGYILTYTAPEGHVKEIRLLPNLSSFTMSQLTPSSQYRVQLRALYGGTSSAPISTSFTTGRLRYPFPRDCWEHRMNGDLKSGPFTIYLGGAREESLPIYCDMETDGGGWIVFQRRMDGSTNFFRDWNDYKDGFGNLTSEFWLGNIALHYLTSSAPYDLRVDLRAGEESAYAVYDDFRVESEDQHFRLRLGQYRGDAGDSLGYHNNMIFSTRDRDAKKRILPCAMSYRGAWWYRNCHYSNLNGMYANNKDHQGINWFTWKGFEFSIPFTEMKIRPRGVGNWRRF
ncbi:tenascin-X [Bombina bombina]|uniref:tenascin-X n=1 Tax=Bombina bombina TaxID=8345 RepID=UPI00235AB79B|nr:tenascin-X [Bombina bombina]